MRYILGAVVSATLLSALPAQAEDAICYNCPPQWADWASMLKAIEAEIGVKMPHDNKNSGQTISQLIAEKASPVADVAYYGVTTGIKAANEGVATAYKPKGFDDIAEGLKDPDGRWFTIHYGTLGLFVNKDALGGAPVPACWADLMKPEYEGMVGYLDPSSAFVGYAGAVAVNRAFGGDLDNFDPAIAFFNELAENDPIVPKQTSYARVVSGEIPILFDYDFNAYRGKYTEDGNFEFVLPCEGSVVVPYVMSLVANGPKPEVGKKVLDFILSDKGQAIWTNAFLKPARPVELPADVAAKFLPDSDYERATPVDYAKMEQVQKAFGDRYLAEVK
ncbi:ABC transporter substrate-binding protein [Pararhizobium sp. IMCC21322]|uniref:ABC transporter substrate-binding protein n=1 Tax=Pararhizobium sp. IMCC21322 TaxID=3067903 RepID=UPI0027410211|nr:ABC transporter substrate-binding protein [Pararhizobium sp. IMCC21322]